MDAVARLSASGPRGEGRTHRVLAAALLQQPGRAGRAERLGNPARHRDAVANGAVPVHQRALRGVRRAPGRAPGVRTLGQSQPEHALLSAVPRVPAQALRDRRASQRTARSGPHSAGSGPQAALQRAAREARAGAGLPALLPGRGRLVRPRGRLQSPRQCFHVSTV